MNGCHRFLLRGIWGVDDAFAGRDLAIVIDRDSGEVCWVGGGDESPPWSIEERLGGASHHLAAGLIDLHVHGASGHDFADATREAFDAICQAHARHGTTALVATVLASSPETTLRAIDVARQVMGRAAGYGARVLGINLEGPFLSQERAGAQPREHLRSPDLLWVDEVIDASAGTLRVMTVAPELPGALAICERLVAAGVAVSMGHSAATYAEALRGIDAGCSLGTHTFNAMRGLHHREPGLAGAVLVRDELFAEVIADGHHVAPPVIELLWRLKGARASSGEGGGKLVLITDCTAALEAPEGGARLGRQVVRVEGGAVRLPDGTLAGSALTMERAVANVARFSGASLAAAHGAASRTPAAFLGPKTPLGRPEIGAPGDFLIYDPAGDLEEVFVAGIPQRVPLSEEF
ncbi:MAG: N-acetylglucosamine-6-phosphate deacetylase [Deltaproteobacteria bacterium]|nr:N-acetylglucosamine-6-phosphate deacetylase [Deltaproteobacteria bacterium]